jgi:hypothetical protein
VEAGTGQHADEFTHAELQTRRAGDPSHGQVFAHDHGFEIVGAGEHGAGYVFVTLGLQHAQHLEIFGQSIDAGYAGFLYGLGGRVPSGVTAMFAEPAE